MSTEITRADLSAGHLVTSLTGSCAERARGTGWTCARAHCGKEEKKERIGRRTANIKGPFTQRFVVSLKTVKKNVIVSLRLH